MLVMTFVTLFWNEAMLVSVPLMTKLFFFFYIFDILTHPTLDQYDKTVFSFLKNDPGML